MSRSSSRRSSFVRHAKSLAFASVRFTGRTEEVKKLRDVYHSPCDKGPKVVLVSGYSGTGKSSLLETLQEVESEDGACFCVGKQEQQSNQT
eukprot:CAMPEP_0194040030 /NCGR_PEP_ID=MMETSP0009_2-20130614/12093_1 /TAXON_ID=210454 /ORGANISM="Grammatophora oceanica, Strain CCMP 410" /LENGTH=90 /DNA_ID=CAMNT_0038683043 /DNA_START=103 /DNA_END=372 /DNA_ORIENTATION=-